MVSSAEIKQIIYALGTIVAFGIFLMCYHGNIWLVLKLKVKLYSGINEELIAMIFRKFSKIRGSDDLDSFFLPSYVRAVYAMMILSYLFIVFATAATLFSVFVKKIKYGVPFVFWSQYCFWMFIGLSLFAANHQNMFPDFYKL